MFTRSTDVKKAISISILRKGSRWKCIVEVITRTAVGVSLVICALIASSSAQEQAPAAVPVGTVQAERKAIAKTKDFVGRVEAINKVEVHARVTGYLEDVLFKEGEFVKEGQRLSATPISYRRSPARLVEPISPKVMWSAHKAEHSPRSSVKTRCMCCFR